MEGASYIRKSMLENNQQITDIQGNLEKKQGELKTGNLSHAEKATMELSINTLKQQKQDYIIANEKLAKELAQIEKGN